LQFEQLVEHLALLIQTVQWFPYEFRAHKTGEPVDEMGCIEHVAPDHFVYHVQRGQAHNPLTLAESSKQSFATARAAARHYLKWTLHLPGDLDSWQVV
jgi:hypothetical protein